MSDLVVTGNLRVQGNSTTAGQVFQQDSLYVESFTRLGSLACQGAIVAAETAMFNSAVNVAGPSTFTGDITVPTAVQSPALWDAEGKLKSGSVGILQTTGPQNFPTGVTSQTINGFSALLLNNCSQQGTASSFKVNAGGVYSVQVTFAFQSTVSTDFITAGITVGPSSTASNNNFYIGWGGDTLNVSGGLVSGNLCGCVLADKDDYISAIFTSSTNGNQLGTPATFSIYQID